MLAFFFSGSGGASAAELTAIIREALFRAKNAGALVKLLVCDQGSNNQKAYTELGVGPGAPFFFLGDDKYNGSFDWPHLIKRLIHHLEKYKLIYCKGKIIMNFDDVIRTWEIDAASGTSNVLGHFTRAHFEPNGFEAMNVQGAFQLLSQKMAASTTTAGESKQLISTTWKDSVKFVNMMNNVIDACNTYKLINRDALKRPSSDRNPEIKQCLLDFVKDVGTWTVKHVSKKNKITYKRPP